MNNDKVYVVASYLDTVPGRLIKLRAEMKFWNRYLGDGYSHVSLSYSVHLHKLVTEELTYH